MLKVEIKDTNNKGVETVTVPAELYGCESRGDILHASVMNYLANQRQGTAATKTRGLVRGGGKKPWRQKHTGRARHGSIRSPIWKGGGTVFGPQPRDYSYNLNKKFKALALRTAISEKYRDNQMIVIDDLSRLFGSDDVPKTKKIVELLKTFGIDNSTVLIVQHDHDSNITKSARNIPGVDTIRASDLNTYDVMAHDVLLMTKGSMTIIQDRLYRPEG